eukprot:jgi/Chrzof1/14393/Cz09g00330.t1
MVMVVVMMVVVVVVMMSCCRLAILLFTRSSCWMQSNYLCYRRCWWCCLWGRQLGGSWYIMFMFMHRCHLKILTQQHSRCNNLLYVAVPVEHTQLGATAVGAVRA